MIKAQELAVGDQVAGLGEVAYVRVHFDGYKPPKPSYAGTRRRPTRTTHAPFKPVAVVELRIEGREAPVFLWPKQRVEVVRASVSETDDQDRGSILAPSEREAA